MYISTYEQIKTGTYTIEAADADEAAKFILRVNSQASPYPVTAAAAFNSGDGWKLDKGLNFTP